MINVYLDIVTEINMLNMKTVSHPYDIPTKLLKLFKDTCSKCSLHILNNYIFNSIFDNELKYANITRSCSPRRPAGCQVSEMKFY